jgi:4-amino-4-deoxy-L-arabinose transferase-like glycosyltransferase
VSDPTGQLVPPGRASPQPRAFRLPTPAAALARRARAIPPAAAILVVLALVQGLAWAAMTAPFNGPDEPAHIAYAQLLAEMGHGPKALGGTGTVSTEVGRAEYELNLVPIFAHADARPTFSAVDRVSRALERLPASQRTDGTGPNAVAQNPPLYYAYEAVAYRLSPAQSLLGRVFAMRAANVLLYAVTVALMWLVAGEIFARHWLRLLATGIVALHPKLASMAGNVNPDTMLVTISTASLLAGLRLLRRGPTTGGVVAVALLAGLGALTHGRGLALIPPALLVIAIAWIRARPGRWALGRQAVLGGGALLACLAVAFLWTKADSGTGGAFGGEVGRAATEPFSVGAFLSYLWRFYLPDVSVLTPRLGPSYGYRQVFIETFFGGYGNYEVNFRPHIYVWLQRLAFVGLVGLAATTAIRFRAIRARWPVVLFAVSTFVSLLALLHISSYRDLQVGGDPLLTGRYLLPCIALFGLAIAWVVGSLPRRLAPLAGAVGLAAFVLIDVEAFLINAQRFYG